MIEDAIFTRLTTHAGLSALIGTRAYPLQAPQNAATPFLVYQRVSAQRISAMGNDTGLARGRFQVSCFASTYSSAKDVAAQARAALQRWRGTVNGTTIQDTYFENDVDVYNPGTLIYHVAIDVEIIYEE